MMEHHFLKSKIHRAAVTEADLNYIGSITIDEQLLEEANILPYEKVQVVNNNNGARIETYVFKGERGSGIICLNGAAARHFEVDDRIIIMSYCVLSTEEITTHRPRVVVVDEKNNITEKGNYDEKGHII